MSIFKRFEKFDYLIILLCLFHFGMNILWIVKNTAPLPWDQAGHTLITFDFLSFFKGEAAKNFWGISTYYPPLVHILTAFAMLPFGASPEIGQLVVTIFFILSIVLLYFYTNELFSSRKTGLIAAFIFSFLPLIYGLSRWFLLEIPLITFVLASLFFAQKSENFSKPKHTVLFALSVTASLLTKWTAIVFLMPVLLQVRKKTNAKLLIVALLIIILLTVPWYSKNIVNISEITQFSLTGNAADPKVLITRENLVWYLSSLANFELTWIGAVFFFLSTIYLIYRKNKQSVLLLGTILFGYIVFTLIQNKNARYILPLLPLTTIIIANFIVRISRNKLIQILLPAIFIPYLLLYFFSLSFGFPIDPKTADYQRAVNLPIIGWIDYVNFGRETSRYLAPAFDSTKWPNITILENLSSFAKDKKINILLVVDKENLNLSNLYIDQRINNIKNLNLSTPYTTFSFSSYEEMQKYVAYFHIALIAEKSFGPSDALRHKKSLQQLKTYIESNPAFQKIEEYPLPDDDILLLYNLNKE